MINLNTNLSSIITQRSLATSTQRLNQAIEQMTTGFKINHAKDNAANYNITTNMTTKIGAYMVAEDNCAMGLDLLATANGSLDQISDKLQRLRALAVQTSNGTYGEKSKEAINQEANAIVDEIERIYNTTEYNGIKFKENGVQESGFIKEILRRDTGKMVRLIDCDDSVVLDNGTYSISTPEELAKLATMTNNGLIGEDTEFVLANDIDLSCYANWTPIGTSPNKFQATFDGNGYGITDLYIDNTAASSKGSGLFGYICNSEIKNLFVLGNLRIFSDSALLVSSAYSSVIENTYALGSVTFAHKAYSCGAGLIAGAEETIIKDSYFEGNVEGGHFIGGIIGLTRNTLVENCYSKGVITGEGRVGGIVGENQMSLGSVIKDCITEMKVVGLIDSNTDIGGIIGCVAKSIEIYNCHVIVQQGSTHGGVVGRVSFKTKINDSSIIGNSDKISSIFVNSLDWTSLLEMENCSYSSNYKMMGLDYISGRDNSIFEDSIFVSETLRHSINKNSYIRKNDITMFQVGTNNANKEHSVKINLSKMFVNVNPLKEELNLVQIDKCLLQLSDVLTELGAAQNRLESALDEISVQYENLVSSRSTLRDADISEVSSEYIRQQILQQASATLMATANQSPSIALQLI